MPFKRGQSGNPAGKPRGARDKYPRSAKRAVTKLLEDFGNDVALIKATLTSGLKAKPPSSFPYLKLIVEQQVGQPELPIATRVIFEDAPPRE